MNRDDYVAANRAAWNEAAPIHARYTLDGIVESLKNGDCRYLDDIAQDFLARLGIAGKRVAQLGCNNGRELCCIERLGAGRCVGFDIADAFVQQAREIAAQTGCACEFVQADIVAIPAAYDASFDLVLITKGTLGWHPDLKGFFRAAARLLAPAGALFLYEMHPILDMFWDAEQTEPALAQHSYFRTAPFVDYSGLDFYSQGEARTTAPAYWFHHTAADIVEGCLDAGLTPIVYREYGHNVTHSFARFAQHARRFPLTLALVASPASAATQAARQALVQARPGNLSGRGTGGETA
jgi:SAM-dependent methyltransferase